MDVRFVRHPAVNKCSYFQLLFKKRKYEIIKKASVHKVIDTFNQLLDVVVNINVRFARGERPLKDSV